MTTLEQTIQVVSQYLHAPVKEDTALLRDTYMDSMDMAELSCVIESHFDIEVRWSEWQSIITPDITVEDIAKLVTNHLKI
jgi:acyl carrier protein